MPWLISIPNSARIGTNELIFSYSFFSVWTHKLRFLAKLLPIPKRAKNSPKFVCLRPEKENYRRMYVMIFYNTENPRDKMN